MPRRSRTTTPQQPTPRPSMRAQASSLPLVVGIPAEHLAVYSEAQQHEIAKAQTCYMLRQQRLDPRIGAYYNHEPIDAERLDDAVRILMGLFDAKAMPEVTLEGALGFASLLTVVAFEAEDRRQRPALPMPYRYLMRRELDAVDALNGTDNAAAEERLLEPRAPRRQRRTKKTTTPTEGQQHEEGVSHERQTRRRTTTRPTTAATQALDPASALPVVRKGGRAARTGSRNGAHLPQALRAVAR